MFEKVMKETRRTIQEFKNKTRKDREFNYVNIENSRVKYNEMLDLDSEVEEILERYNKNNK